MEKRHEIFNFRLFSWIIIPQASDISTTSYSFTSLAYTIPKTMMQFPKTARKTNPLKKNLVIS